MVVTAPGKLILTGEYAVLDGAPAIVIAVDRRAVARLGTGEGSPFLDAVAREVAARCGISPPAIAVDSAAFYDGSTKFGLGSSAAVTVAATALSLAHIGELSAASLQSSPSLGREESLPEIKGRVLTIALAAHAAAQAPRGTRGSGADVAAAVYGGVIVYESCGARIDRLVWPESVRLIPFFTGHSADTASLVARVLADRTPAIDAALVAIAEASRAVEAAMVASIIAPSRVADGESHRSAIAPDQTPVASVIAAFARAADAIDQLAQAAAVPLVPACVTAARAALAPLGGTAKTTGAGGGDVAIAVVPAEIDVTIATRRLIEAGCTPLTLSVDPTGVDTRPGAL